jgi:exopolysaccharide biosynthesis protein
MKLLKCSNIIYILALVGFTVYVVLDAFVISRSYEEVDKSEYTITAESTLDAGTAEYTDDGYTDSTTNISFTTYEVNDTTVYVADITLSRIDSLKTAFANDTYGKNITDKTSKIAASNDALLAINGDYYSARNGYVIRNGVLYRDKSAGDDQEDLVIYSDGSCGIIREGDVTAEELLEAGAVHVFSFGPGLVSNGKVIVDEDDEVGRAMASNPRTAIGWIDGMHYVFVVSDGRTNESEGLSLEELAEFMQGLGVKVAYNLDGGGSSTMYYNGEIVNNPTTNGRKISERSVSDIVYIG